MTWEQYLQNVRCGVVEDMMKYRHSELVEMFETEGDIDEYAESFANCEFAEIVGGVISNDVAYDLLMADFGGGYSRERAIRLFFGSHQDKLTALAYTAFSRVQIAVADEVRYQLSFIPALANVYRRIDGASSVRGI